jgi:2-methylcitrate dehydratase PrpD
LAVSWRIASQRASSPAKYLILDAVGVALASTTCDFAHRAMTAIGGLAGQGDAAVIGMPARLPPRDAALLNGILIHGLDARRLWTSYTLSAISTLSFPSSTSS